MPVPVIPTGAPIWIELESSDLDASRAFYEGLFGWATQSMGPEFGDYVTLALGDARVGGAVPNRSGGGDSWIVSLQSPDIETTATAVRDAEGDVLLGPHAVGDLGSMLMALDSHGVQVAAWQAGTNAGIGVMAEPGAPAWFELHTSGYDESIRFYQRAFGWETATMADTPEFRYSQLTSGGEFYAGVFDATADLAPGAPGHWLVYFHVSDADATVEKAQALGATVVEAPVDTPFGRMATLVDPTGAKMRVIA